MKPEAMPQNFNLELSSTKDANSVERKSSFNSAELNKHNNAERQLQGDDAAPIATDANITTILPVPVVDANIVDNSTTTNNNPPIANDDDLIEKEWVDKAKRIVYETRDNPHQREKAVNELQVDYLKKRYGRGLDVTE